VSHGTPDYDLFGEWRPSLASIENGATPKTESSWSVGFQCDLSYFTGLRLASKPHHDMPIQVKEIFAVWAVCTTY
jgi:hypothetical protein